MYFLIFILKNIERSSIYCQKVFFVAATFDFWRHILNLRKISCHKIYLAHNQMKNIVKTQNSPSSHRNTALAAILDFSTILKKTCFVKQAAQYIK
jgi:hypothetical protein